MEQALTEHEIKAVVREVTEEEVAHYHEYGWVMMKQLVDRSPTRPTLTFVLRCTSMHPEVCR
jgi:hypothetical protein